jgi:hypothetical protein
VLNKQVAVLKQVGDLLLQSLPLTDGPLGGWCGRPTTLPSRLTSGQRFPHLGHGPQDGLGQFLENMEFADLVRHVVEHRTQRLRIKRRTIGGDAQQGQFTVVQRLLESAQERLDVLVIRIVIEHLVDEPLKGAVVDDGQDSERTVIQFVGGDVAGEVSQGPIEVVAVHLIGRLFPPGLYPVLDGGVRDKNPVVAPKVPTGGLIR